MPDQTPSPSPEPVIPSVLGTDPPKIVVPSSPETKVAETKAVETKASSKTTFTQEQIDDIQHKASNYDIIANDPELAAKVMDHFRAKTGKVGTPQKAPTPPVNIPEQTEIQREMVEKFAELSRRSAQQEIKLFKMEHPDMDEVKDDMAKLVKQYSMSLEDAYRFSKAAKAQPQQKPAKAPPVVPTAETNESAGEDEQSPDTTFEEVEKQINDPKATPHMDDAILKAFQAAKKLQVAQ